MFFLGWSWWVRRENRYSHIQIISRWYKRHSKHSKNCHWRLFLWTGYAVDVSFNLAMEWQCTRCFFSTYDSNIPFFIYVYILDKCERNGEHACEHRLKSYCSVYIRSIFSRTRRCYRYLHLIRSIRSGQVVATPLEYCKRRKNTFDHLISIAFTMHRKYIDRWKRKLFDFFEVVWIQILVHRSLESGKPRKCKTNIQTKKMIGKLVRCSRAIANNYSINDNNGFVIQMQ